MKLYPQHLRDRQHAEIIKRRSFGLEGKGSAEGMSHSDPPPPQMGRLGRLWAKRTGLTDRQAATGLPASSMATQTTIWLPTTVIGFLSAILGAAVVKKTEIPADLYYSYWAAGMAALSALCAGPGAGAVFHSLYEKPLRVSEIDYLLEGAETDLDRAYLTLVRDAIRQEVPEQSQEDIRAAIQALGEAIDRLPVVTVRPLDTVALREEADRLAQEAGRQTDRVIAESLERKADALRHRASAHERSALYVRRSAALRSEIEAQVEALREGLAAFNAGMAVTADMAHLSESARRVAAEAVSTADAREEVEKLLSDASSAVAEATTAQTTTTPDQQREPSLSVGAGRR
jgi:hypothetical protein